MTTVANLDGMFKEVYGDLQDLTPTTDILASKIKFEEQNKEGDSFHFPVVLTHEGGATYNGTSYDEFALNSAISHISKDATVQGTEYLLRSRVAYAVLARTEQAMAGEKSSAGRKRAFISGTKHMMKAMMARASADRELALLYGCGTASTPAASLGAIESQSGSGTTRALVLTDLTWSSAIWQARINSEFDAYSGSTKQNSNAAIVLVSVDPSTRTLNVSGNATDLDACTAGILMLPRGSATKAAYGLDAIATNTGSLFGISASTYNLWKAGSYSCGSGPLTFAKAIRGLERPASLGYTGNWMLLCNPSSFTDLNEDIAALVRYGKAKGDFELGAESIKYASHAGTLEVLPYIYCKRGEAFAIKTDTMHRIGATDLTNQMPGVGQILFNVDGYAAVEMRTYSLQAVICDTPAALVKYTAIVPSASAA